MAGGRVEEETGHKAQGSQKTGPKNPLCALRLFQSGLLHTQRRALFVSEATDEVIVHHSGCLHVRVDDRCADEAKAAFL
jgi:hypothetical protein